MAKLHGRPAISLWAGTNVEMHHFEKHIVNTAATTFFHGRVLLEFALAQARPVEGDVLEVGCGQGATTRILVRKFPHARIRAIDIDEEQVERARRRVRGRASIDRGDVMRLAFADASFDTVFALNMLHHVAEPLAAMREIHRVLRPGGQFVFTDYTRRFFLGPIPRLLPPETMFSAGAFLGMLQDAGFRVDGFRGSWIVTGAATKRREPDL